MDMLMKARGATPSEKQRGLEAAKAVLARAGMAAEEAADGAFAVEGWDDMGFPADKEPSEAEYAAADVWYAANNAALEACCAGWSDEKRIQAHGLELLTDPEEQLADRDTALERLRAIVRAKRGHRRNSEKVFLLACRVAEELENAQRIVGDVTVAYTQLEFAPFHRDEPVEPKRQAVLDAIDALEKAPAPG